jgi:hypothetical protein
MSVHSIDGRVKVFRVARCFLVSLSVKFETVLDLICIFQWYGVIVWNYQTERTFIVSTMLCESIRLLWSVVLQAGIHLTIGARPGIIRASS